MCGIVGYKGEREENIGVVLLNCIRNLEYRGYDSIGMAVRNNSEILSKKGIGKIGEANAKLNFSNMKGNIGIAHTRWATNGNVTTLNSHPHHDINKNVYLVHNGIIENHQELRTRLKKEGIECISETDSEVIVQLIGMYLSSGISLIESVKKTLRELKGSYALSVISKDSNDMIIARKDSPLVLGVGKYRGKLEYFVASDVPAFLSYCKKVVYLDDNEIGIISDNSFEIYDLNANEKKHKEIVEIEWNIEQAQKGEYEHFMLKEIFEQKETIKKAVLQDDKNFNDVINIMKNACGIFFVGCGTSYHAAVSASYVFSHVAKKHVNVVLASEFRNYESFLTDKTVIVAISQSGETADLLDAVKTAKNKGAKIVSIVNVMGSTLMRLSENTILMNAGPEICVLSTKSYTSQLAILLQFAYGMVDKRLDAKEMVLSASNSGMKCINSNKDNIKKIAEKIKDSHSMFLIGRDLAYPSALEGALKIKEVSYIHAEGFAGGELKHGTIALIEKNVPCIVLVTDNTREMILSNAAEIKTRGGYIIGIDSKNNDIYDDWIEIDEVGSADPISMIMPIQILSYYLALLRGCDPDKPRNLAKSVTVK